MSQLTLVDVPRTSRVRAVVPSPEIVDVAARIPSRVRMGTSSWSFSGWNGLLYDGNYDERALANEGLAAYSAHPLMRTVGVDRGHYAPISRETHADLAAQVPADFRFLVKAHDELTLVRLHQRHGDRAGERNERFLDASYANDVVVGPFVEGLGDKAGVLLFQFAQIGAAEMQLIGGPERLVDALFAFLSALPRGPKDGYVYAVELRNPELFAPDIAPRMKGALFAADAVPCFGMRTGMPDVRGQVRALLPDQPRALVVRWLLRDGLTWDEGEQRYFPYDKLKDEDPDTRDDLAKLVKEIEAPTWIIANNKAEGCSVRTVEAFARALAG